jgi:hypothetical protein
MTTCLEQVGRGGQVEYGQCHNIWFVQSRPTFDLSEVGLRQQSQYNAQLEHRVWRCFFRPFLSVGHNGFTQRYVLLLLSDFHFPDTIFRACGWMMGLKHVEHVYQVRYSLVMTIETYRLCLFLNCFSLRLVCPFCQKPSHVPAIPMHVMVMADAIASAFPLLETNHCPPLAI